MSNEDAAAIQTELKWLKESVLQTKKAIDEVKDMLDGEDGKLGMAQKVNILWRIHAIMAGIVGATTGSIATYLAMKMVP